MSVATGTGGDVLGAITRAGSRIGATSSAGVVTFGTPTVSTSSDTPRLWVVMIVGSGWLGAPTFARANDARWNLLSELSTTAGRGTLTTFYAIVDTQRAEYNGVAQTPSLTFYTDMEVTAASHNSVAAILTVYNGVDTANPFGGGGESIYAWMAIGGQFTIPNDTNATGRNNPDFVQSNGSEFSPPHRGGNLLTYFGATPITPSISAPSKNETLIGSSVQLKPAFYRLRVTVPSGVTGYRVDIYDQNFTLMDSSPAAGYDRIYPFRWRWYLERSPETMGETRATRTINGFTYQHENRTNSDFNGDWHVAVGTTYPPPDEPPPPPPPPTVIIPSFAWIVD